MSTAKKQKAGKASGARRANLAKLRQLKVLAAHERLNRPYQDQPFSEHSLDELEKELVRQEQELSKLKALERTLSPPLSADECAVDIIEDGASHLLGRKAPDVRKRLFSEKHEALLDEVIRGLDPDQKQKSQRKLAVQDHRSRDRLVSDLKALKIRSKRRKKRSR
jgi:hypothetical protein